MNIQTSLRSWLDRTRPTTDRLRSASSDQPSSASDYNDAAELRFNQQLERAKRFRSQHRSHEALTCFRRALLASPNHASTWIDYAHVSLSLQRPAEAHAAFLNSLELDPSNLSALEMLFDVSAQLGGAAIAAQARRYLVKAGKDLVGAPQRHLGSLDFLIPMRVTSGDDAVLAGPDARARALLTLHREPVEQHEEILSELEIGERNDVLARFYLLRGRRTAAEKTLTKLGPDSLPVDTLRRYARRQSNLGKHQNVLMATRFLLKANPSDEWAKAKRSAAEQLYRESDAASEKLRLLSDGFPVPEFAPRSTLADPRSVLYLLHNSLPYSSAGYATRSHGLISQLRRLDFDVAGVTRPGYPFDRPEVKGVGEVIPRTDNVSGTPYYRLSTSAEHVPKHPLTPYVYEYARRLEDIAQQRGAGIIHAASNHWNGLAATVAARRLGIPSVYEVRGLWEITRISREPDWNHSLDFDFMAEMETQAALQASRVLTITAALRDEMIARGVPDDRIEIVPNGVDTKRFVPRIPDHALKERLGLSGRTIIGYVGSVLDYEGIGTLIDAATMLARDESDFHVLVVGDGSYLETARARVHEARLDDFITFVGRVPHTEVESYYSIIDIAPIPRHSLPVTEMVSPLKPFEAMAMGKVVVGSDVAAIDEIIVDEVNGLLFRKDDPASLARVLGDLLNSPDRISDLGTSAREWVVQHRDWSHIAERVAKVYRDLA